MDKQQFAEDGSIVMAICAACGLPVPMPEELQQEEAIFLVANCAVYLLKRSLNGREDAEHINYLWIEAERKMFNHAD